MAWVKKGSVKSLGASLGAAVILALCARSMFGATAIGSVRVAFGRWQGEYHILTMEQGPFVRNIYGYHKGNIYVHFFSNILQGLRHSWELL